MTVSGWKNSSRSNTPSNSSNSSSSSSKRRQHKAYHPQEYGELTGCCCVRSKGRRCCCCPQESLQGLPLLQPANRQCFLKPTQPQHQPQEQQESRSASTSSPGAATARVVVVGRGRRRRQLMVGWKSVAAVAQLLLWSILQLAALVPAAVHSSTGTSSSTSTSTNTLPRSNSIPRSPTSSSSSGSNSRSSRLSSVADGSSSSSSSSYWGSSSSSSTASSSSSATTTSTEQRNSAVPSTASSSWSSSQLPLPCPPWNPSRHIDPNGFVTSLYTRIPGEWEQEMSKVPSSSKTSSSSSSSSNGNSNAESSANPNTGKTASSTTACDLILPPVHIRQVPGDGNCLFHSISLALHYAVNGTHWDLTGTRRHPHHPPAQQPYHQRRQPKTENPGAATSPWGWFFSNNNNRQRHDGPSSSSDTTTALASENSLTLQDLYEHSRQLRWAAVACLRQSHKRLFLQGQESLRAHELVQAAAAQYGMTAEEYCHAMEQDSVWGGGPEIVALCNLLQRPIHVYELAVLTPEQQKEILSSTRQLLRDSQRERQRQRSRNSKRDNNNNEVDLDNDDLTRLLLTRLSLPSSLSLSSGSGKTRPIFGLRRMACFGSPKFDNHNHNNNKHSQRQRALHILSADSRFPDLEPGNQLAAGNHFLAVFPVEPHEWRALVEKERARIRHKQQQQNADSNDNDDNESGDAARRQRRKRQGRKRLVRGGGNTLQSPALEDDVNYDENDNDDSADNEQNETNTNDYDEQEEDDDIDDEDDFVIRPPPLLWDPQNDFLLLNRPFDSDEEDKDDTRHHSLLFRTSKYSRSSSSVRHDEDTDMHSMDGGSRENRHTASSSSALNCHSTMIPRWKQWCRNFSLFASSSSGGDDQD